MHLQSLSYPVNIFLYITYCSNYLFQKHIQIYIRRRSLIRPKWSFDLILEPTNMMMVYVSCLQFICYSYLFCILLSYLIVWFWNILKTKKLSDLIRPNWPCVALFGCNWLILELIYLCWPWSVYLTLISPGWSNLAPISPDWPNVGPN